MNQPNNNTENTCCHCGKQFAKGEGRFVHNCKKSGCTERLCSDCHDKEKAYLEKAYLRKAISE